MKIDVTITHRNDPMNDHLRQEIDALLADKAGEAERTAAAVAAALAAVPPADTTALDAANAALQASQDADNAAADQIAAALAPAA